MRHRSTVHALLLAATATTLLGQSAEQRLLDAPSGDIHGRLHVDSPGDGTTWVRGRSYKARFAPDSATYVPFLGSDAPRNFPVRFELDEVRVGARSVAFDRAATVSVEDGVATLDRGSVNEHYVLGLESIEQRFTFDTLPDRAEVTVSMSVESDLVGLAADTGIAFEGAFGGVRYGAAVAVDGAGRRRAMPLDYDATRGRLELRVPADFVAAATLPLTIDPIVTTFTIDDVNAELTDPDIAYAVTPNLYYVVYQEFFSGQDADIYGTLVDEAGNLQGSGYVDQTSANWIEPAVAYNREAERFLVVASARTSHLDEFAIWARGRSPILPVFDAPFQVSDASSLERRRPDVGGSLIAGHDVFAVVWDADRTIGGRDIQSRAVRSNGTRLTQFTLANSAQNDDWSPSIAKTTGPETVNLWRWPVVWERNSDALRGSILGGTAGQVFGLGFDAGEPTEVCRDPSPSSFTYGNGGGPRWVLAYELESTNDTDIMTQLFSLAAPISSVNLSVLQGNSGFDEASPEITTDGERYMVISLRDHPTLDWEPTVSTIVDLAGQLILTEGPLFASGETTREFFPVITARATGGGDVRQCLMAWSQDHLQTLSIEGGLYLAPITLGGQASLYCDPAVTNSTGNDARLRLAPDASMAADDDLQLRGLDLPAGQFCYPLASMTEGDVFPAGSSGRLCLGGQIFRYVNLVAPSDASGEIALSLDPAQILAEAGETWNFQLWFRDAPDSNFTNGLKVRFQ